MAYTAARFLTRGLASIKLASNPTRPIVQGCRGLSITQRRHACCSTFMGHSCPGPSATASSRPHSTVIVPTPQEALPPEIQRDPVLDVLSVQENSEKRWIEVKWGDGEVSPYPYVWLKDNCQCPSCFHPFTKARLLLMRHLDVHITPTDIKVDEVRDELVVTWADGHVSPYPFEWLRKRRFCQEAQATHDLDYHAKPIHWDAAMMQGKIPAVDYTEMMEDERVFYKWLTYFEQYGLVLINDAPTEYGRVEAIAKKISFIRRTQYGELYDVITRENPPNLAYTAAPLGLHTDMPCELYSPGIQLLHCFKQSEGEGGDSEYVDCFHVVDQLRQEYPEYYDLLTRVEVDFWDVGEESYDFHKRCRHPTVRLGLDSKVMRIAYSNQMRDSYLKLPVEKVDLFYKALRKFDDLMYDPKNLVITKLEPGQIVAFHNIRVLHGRRGFGDKLTGERHLHGFFMDWDELHSRRRMVKQKLGITNE